MTALDTTLNRDRLAALADELRELLTPGSEIRTREPLAKRTTLRVGGPADLFVEPQTEGDLGLLLGWSTDRRLPVTVLGRGSNLVIRDGGIRGVVLSLAHEGLSRIEVDGTRLRCGAGARLKAVSNEARKAGLTGLEFLEGIPGSVGGALRMNAGAMGAETFKSVERLRFMGPTGEVSEMAVSEVPVEYRCCPLLKTHIALGAIFVGQPATPEEIRVRMDQFNTKRWTTQPPQPSAGCTFKNAPAIPTGKLVEELGLKGTHIGGAMVSGLHGNFIVNLGNATARDVLALIEKVRQCALDERGIELQTEVEILGED
jgi:UDP-N-acetylenolpyruvoylglucosamine reductase